jgi:hypothetical protein
VAGGWREPLHAGDAISRTGSIPSRFVPMGCSLPDYTNPTRVQDAVKGYEAIHVIGDSLSRLTMQAVRLLLFGDWVSANNSKLERIDCVCDGLFAEWPTACREAFIPPGPPFDYSQPASMKDYKCATSIKVPRLKCPTPSSTKRIAIWLQPSGLHCKTVAAAYLAAAQPLLATINSSLAECRDRYIIFAEALPQSAPALEQKHPHQRRS